MILADVTVEFRACVKEVVGRFSFPVGPLPQPFRRARFRQGGCSYIGSVWSFLKGLD